MTKPLVRVVDLIERKRDGGELTKAEIEVLIDRYTAGDVPDYQMSALLMAIYLKGLSNAELSALTAAMLHSGDVVDLSGVAGIKVDKHSTGGVGDKISIPLAPLVAACGVPVPMCSGRGLGHTGGTLDKLESIPGFTTQLTEAEYIAQMKALGMCMIGQTGEIAPADKKLYALRDVTGTVSSIPLITSSIMSKKLAEGMDALVLDVKVGSGAFMNTRPQARALAEAMCQVSERMGKRTVALITDMNQPLGEAVGNALEIKESIEILKGRGPADVRALTIALAEEMLALGGVDPAEATRALDDGRALEMFRRLVETQGGDVSVIDDPDAVLVQAPHREAFVAEKAGYITAVDTQAVGLAALVLGAGRMTTDAKVDLRVGLMIQKRVGDRVEAGEPILWIHHAETGLADARARLAAAYTIGDAPPEARPLILERIDGAQYR